MPDPLKLMAVVAHPDDESLGVGGTMAKYAKEGVETHLLTATRGERGWFGPENEYPGPQALGEIREAELLNAAAVLGIKEVSFLDYRDAELPDADQEEVLAKIVSHLRRVRPQVVVTFDPNGAYGHPDHIAICQLATAACAASPNPDFKTEGDLPHHSVSKLYYMAWTAPDFAAYEKAFGELVMHIDGVERRSKGWEPWAITTKLDTSENWQQVWKAVECHRSQLPGYQSLLDLPEEYHRQLWGNQTFYRAFSLVQTPKTEADLFDGLR